jgi:hypothetical protein
MRGKWRKEVNNMSMKCFFFSVVPYRDVLFSKVNKIHSIDHHHHHHHLCVWKQKSIERVNTRWRGSPMYSILAFVYSHGQRINYWCAHFDYLVCFTSIELYFDKRKDWNNKKKREAFFFIKLFRTRVTRKRRGRRRERWSFNDNNCSYALSSTNNLLKIDTHE